MIELMLAMIIAIYQSATPCEFCSSDNSCILSACQFGDSGAVCPQCANITNLCSYCSNEFCMSNITICPACSICTGCVSSRRVWKKMSHEITQYLPITLGCAPYNYVNGTNVVTSKQAKEILKFRLLSGHILNGLNILASQLLTAKLNQLNGSSAINTDAADALLCQYGFNPGKWSTLSWSVRDSVRDVVAILYSYNNGDGGVPRCNNH